ncbi:valine--tRNA ligase [Deltaproteobacteria bacterium OttesenSCG-928-K17]|nr:valine--tRNA ligase [Deltaproteobacteria bacterium OttesenSCG-928-K17]
MTTLDKNFNHAEAETRLYKHWEDSGYFKADPKKDGDPFVIVIPPPNVTGNLHMGHALDETLQDILVRYHRMKGDNTLWLPGTDHAGIATQNVVEKSLAAAGSSREELGREKFVEKVWEWKKQYGGNIVHQLRRLGASCDWSRERFTMDEGLSRAVREVFVTLYEQGLIYRDYYIINWCPRCMTALADLEVEHEDKKGNLYYVRYVVAGSGQALTVATTRPETIFGDTAVAVHPDDERYKHLIGQQVEVPLTGRTVPVIADAYVDMEYGTGALKVTPAHDPNDFKLGQTHKLPSVKAILDDGAMGEAAGKYQGQDRFKARENMLPELEEKGLLEKIEPIVHAVGGCYRCKTVVEPNLSRQWFVRTKTLAERAAKAVRDGETVFVPKNWEKTYFEWMDNIRDWCISRQLWWGHQIPAWHCQSCGETTVSREDPAKCRCGGELTRDPDVLDTWFSSGLWPFSTLGWPDKTEDLARYYPTTVLVTGFDIIFFWVARMMMMGLHFMDEVPFKKVIIHALVKDAEGKKMSKSKGNVVDPLEIIDRFGADAFRFTLCSLAGHGRDIRLSDDRIAGYGKFVNKLWNASKLVLSNAGEAAIKPVLDGQGAIEGFDPAPPLSLPDRWMRSRLTALVKEVSGHLDEFYYDRVADTLYHFIWDEFCDWYLELIKPVLYGDDQAAKASTQANMLHILSALVRLLHPVMPFITEELWSKIPGSKGSVMLAPFPGRCRPFEDKEAESRIGFLMDVTRAVRSLRADFGVPQGQKLAPVVKCSAELAETLREYGPLLLKLMGAESVVSAPDGAAKPVDAALAAFAWGEVWLPLAGLIDLAEESKRQAKELATVEKDMKAAQAKLGNADYISKAPEEIVEETRERLAAMEARREAITRSLAMLKEMGA